MAQRVGGFLLGSYRINNEFRIAATEGGPYDVNYCVRRKDGRRMWVRVAAKLRRDEQGIARLCMGVFVDIDDAVKNQARQQQALEQALERADRACKVPGPYAPSTAPMPQASPSSR